MGRQLAATAIALLLTGCGANFTTAYRTFEPVDDGPNSALIDAKQRALFVAPGNMGLQNEEARRKMLVCAEPSPDALSAISSSLSASFGGLFPSGAEVQAALAAALSETASQLGMRNATIQLLRDGLYRQCEAYMNGLIDADYYEQIANKYVNAMVALLAIEQVAPVAATATTIRAGDNATVSTTTSVEVNQESAKPEEAGKTEEKTVTATEADTTATPAAQPAATETPPTQRSGSSNATATAAAPVVSVNIPSPTQREVPEHVSRAVGAIVTTFLTKDTYDYCLRHLFAISSRQNDSPAIIDRTNLTLDDPFVRVCERIIEQQIDIQERYVLNLAKAGTIVIGILEKVEKIVAYTTLDGSVIDTTRLRDLVNKAASASDEMKTFIVSIPNLSRLRSFLAHDAPEAVVNEMYAAIK
jgi:hypothetical protein